MICFALPPLLATPEAVSALAPRGQVCSMPTILLSGPQGRLRRVAWRSALWYAADHSWSLSLSPLLGSPLAKLFPVWHLTREALAASTVEVPAQAVASAYEESLAYAKEFSPRLSAQQAAVTLAISRSSFRLCALSGCLQGIGAPCSVPFYALMAAVEALDDDRS